MEDLMACWACSHRRLCPVDGRYCDLIPVGVRATLPLVPVETWAKSWDSVPGLVVDPPSWESECPGYKVVEPFRPKNSHYYHTLTEDRDYCPGNGTRYHLLLASLSEEDGRIRWLFSWVNAPRCGRSCILYSDLALAASYLEEKLDHASEQDLRALMAWLEKRGLNIISG